MSAPSPLDSPQALETFLRQGIDRHEYGARIRELQGRVIATETVANNAVPEGIFDAKGDLIVASAADTPARHAASGTDNRLLNARAAATNGVEWVGGRTTYTPTWTGSGSNPAIGNGTLTGSYLRLGDMVFFTINVTAGSTTTFGSGSYSLSLPITAAATFKWALTVDLLDAGTQHYSGVAFVNASGTTTAEILVMSNTFGPGNWQHNSPFTFGNGDSIIISGFYGI